MRGKQRKLLLELRRKLVGKLHTQPFTIYNDSTIEDLLDAQPHTLEELVKVKGFPREGKRIKGFGEAVIMIFKDPTKIESIEIKGDSNDVCIDVKTKEMGCF